MRKTISRGTADDMLAAFEQRLDIIDEADSGIESATDVIADSRTGNRSSGHGTSIQMLDAFELKIAQLEDGVNASTRSINKKLKKVTASKKSKMIKKPVKASETVDIDTYADDLASAVNSELEDLDIFTGWNWEVGTDDLTLTTTKEEDVEQYTIPIKDLKFDEKKDTEYIMKAVTKVEDDSIKSATKVSAGKEVEVYDDGTAYIDEQGSLGEPGEVYTMEDIMIMWNSMCNDDWCMEQYSSFDDWWRDTKRWLKETTSACDKVTGSDDFAYDWEINGTFEKIASKQVLDSDGFYTDYTMYQNLDTGEYVFVFGDNDYYSPEDGNYDYECDSEDEAWEWYNSYNGFDDEDDIYSSTKINASTFTSSDILSYLKKRKAPECTLTDDELAYMAQKIHEIAKEEEMMMGEDYESIEAIDINELIDASTDDLHEMGYNWLGLLDYDDDIDASCKVEGTTWDELPHEKYGDDLTPMFSECYYDVIDAGYTDDGQVIVTLNNRVDDIESAAQVLESILEANGMHVSDWNVNGSNVFLFDWIDDYAYEEMQMQDDIYSATAIKANRDDNYFGEVAAFNHGSKIANELGVGATVSKRRDLAEEPGGLIYEANKLGIDMWELLEALEGMCADGRASEIDDSTYKIISTKRHPVRSLFYNEAEDKNSRWLGVESSDEIPFDNSIPANYYYITKHGIGPGMLPKDVEINYIQDLPNGLTSFYLDRFLTTQELNEYDIYPETHDIYTQYPDWIRQASEPNEDEMYDDWQMGKVGRFATDASIAVEASFSDEYPDEFVKWINLLGISDEWEAEMFVHDINNLRGDEWIPEVTRKCPDKLEAFIDFANVSTFDDDVYSASNITASTDLDRLYEISEMFNVSDPVSGDWSTEEAAQAHAIMDEFGISEDEAVNIMVDTLGFDRESVLESLDKYQAVMNRDYPESREAVNSLSEILNVAADEADSLAGMDAIEDLANMISSYPEGTKVICSPSKYGYYAFNKLGSDYWVYGPAGLYADGWTGGKTSYDDADMLQKLLDFAAKGEKVYTQGEVNSSTSIEANHGWMVNHPGYDLIGGPTDPWPEYPETESEKLARKRLEDARREHGAPADANFDGAFDLFAHPDDEDLYWNPKTHAYDLRSYDCDRPEPIRSSSSLDDQEVPCPYCTMPTSRELVRKYGMCWDCYDNNVE